MALGTPTVLLNTYSSTGHGTGSYTTGATSAPAAGSKLIVHVSYITNGGGDPGTSITISDSGGHSWSEPVAQHRRAGSGSDWIGNAFFVADNASTSTITITVDTSAGNIYQWAVQVVQVTGGSGGTIGGKGSVSGTGNTGPSLTLDAAPASADITFGGLEAYEQSFPADPTPGSGFTELAQSGVQYASSQIQYRTASTSTTVAWADNGTSVAGYLGLGFVLKEAASGSTSFSDISIDGVTVTTPTGGQITVPAWAVAGDYVLCCSGGNTGDVTVPGDFAAVTGLVDYDGNNELRAYEKVLDSTDISNGYITVSGSAGWHYTSTIAIFFSGQDTTPVDGTPVTASGFDVSGAGYSTATWASMTPSADNSVTCWFAGVNSGGSWSATPTVDASWSYDTAMAVWGGYYEQTTAAATGAESIHHSVDYERWAAIGVVIRPATASGATGTGASSTSGTASATVTVTATGTGPSATSGDGTADITVDATGSGASATSGSVTADITVVAAGASTSTTSGAGTGVGRRPASGSGTSTTAGVSAATITVDASGAATSATSGTANATVIVVAAGAGTSSTSGTGTATTGSGAVQASGSGTSTTSGTGSATVTVVATGSSIVDTAGTGTATTQHPSTPKQGAGRIRRGAAAQPRRRFARWFPHKVVRVNYPEEQAVADVQAVVEDSMTVEIPDVQLYRSPEPPKALPTSDDELVLMLS